MLKFIKIYSCKTSSQIDLYQIRNYAMRNNIYIEYLQYHAGAGFPAEQARWFNFTYQTQLFQKETIITSPLNTIIMTGSNDSNVDYIFLGKEEIMNALQNKNSF
jgi:hypothetical protein